MREVKFTTLAHSQLLQWKEESPKIYLRVAYTSLIAFRKTNTQE
jgi:hypothetical protein